MSLVLHLAGFGLAIALPRLLPRSSQGPPIVVVDLVSLPEAAGQTAGGAAAPAPPAAPPKKSITPPPKLEKTLKIPEHPPKKADVRKKPPEKPEPKPTPTPAPAKNAHAAAASDSAPDASGTPAPNGSRGGAAGAGAGGAAGSGTGSGDETQFYFTLINRKIEAAWQRPIYPPNETSRRVLTATVRLSLSSSGRVTRLDLVTSSGYDAIDSSVLRAVQEAQPFPPFPYTLTVDSLTVNFAFELTPK